jgi:hypothetical protein
MPARSKRQARFLGAEYSRLKRGKKGKTGMSKEKVKEFLEGVNVSALPETAKGAKKRRKRR